MSTSLFSVMVLSSRQARRTYLLVGLVDPDLLVKAGTELAAYRGTAMIRTSGLTKRFGPVLAVDGVDLQVARGRPVRAARPQRLRQDHAGPDAARPGLRDQRRDRGAGQAGAARVAEVLPADRRAGRGPGGYGHLSGRTNLALLDAAGPGRLGRADPPARVDEALERVGLGGIDNRPVKAYSLGMRQRLGLAAALLRSPRLLILDEPTNGLDPRGIREIRDLLVELNQAGTTVFLSSHLLSEVEQLAPGSACSTAAGWSCRRTSPTCGPRPAGSWCTARMPAGRSALLDGRVERRDADLLLVRHSDPPSFNALLVADGHPGGRDRAGAARVGADRAGVDRSRLRPVSGGTAS